MAILRHMFYALVAVAISLAPIVPALATLAKTSSAPGTISHAHASHMVDGGVDGGGATPMERCASMMKGAAGAHDCACCDKDKTCPHQFCMAKCFQFIGLVEQWPSVARLVTAMLRPTAPEHPPDWSDQPQPPPPRT